MVNQIYILDMNLKVSKILSINGYNSFFDDLYTMELSTGTETFEFSTTVNIDEGEYVAFNYKNQYKLFSVLEIEQERSENNIITTCYCECATLELINQVVRSFRGDFNCIKFMEYVLRDTEWGIGYYSPSLQNKIQTVNVESASNVWSIIQEYMPKYNYEINTRIEIEGNQVKKYYIDLYDADEDALGRATKKRFEYSRNIEGIIKKKDLNEWCTGIIIEGVDVSDVLFDVTGYTKNGDVIIDDYANETYNKNRKPIYGVYQANEDDSATACTNALAELKRRSTPHWDYEVSTAMSFEEYEEICIGDEIYIIDKTYNPQLLLSARVSELCISFTNPNDCSLTLANYKETISSIKSNIIIGTEFMDYINSLTEGILSQAQIQTLIEYIGQINTEHEQINMMIAELKKISVVNFSEVERNSIYGANVNITLNEGKNYYCRDTVSYIKFVAPNVDSCTDDYNVTLTFATRDDAPTGIHQDNDIWLVGDNSCDNMDVVNGGLLPKCDCSYTIVITKNTNLNYPRNFIGVVSKVNNSGYEYIGFNNVTNYSDEIVDVMQSYYDNREGNFKYSTITPYSFTNPQANVSKWKTDNLNHCDCATYVSMACRGIDYDNSIYTDDTKNPYLCSNKYKWAFDMPSTVSEQARYCLEQGWVLDLDVTNLNDWAKLQSGDLVFWKQRTGDDDTNEEVNAKFMQIGHVAIVKSINNVNGQLIPYTLESTSMELCFYNRSLTDNHSEKLLFFARPRK